MNLRYLVYLLLIVLVAASCQKNEMSKIPQIGLNYFGPETIRFNYDTAFLLLSLQDGDADLGNDKNGKNYDIYIKDFRFDTGYAGYFFPDIDLSIEDPKKGITGTCMFYFIPAILSPRSDSLHTALGDTTHFEVYIKDRAGNQSNHVTTGDVILVP
jgi:hypothetical protein